MLEGVISKMCSHYEIGIDFYLYAPCVGGLKLCLNWELNFQVSLYHSQKNSKVGSSDPMSSIT